MLLRDRHECYWVIAMRENTQISPIWQPNDDCWFKLVENSASVWNILQAQVQHSAGNANFGTQLSSTFRWLAGRG
ncbi:hypothetical protein A5320_18255 [Rheinheimera sp. SA_1]|nr:hypothetical protein A5320_18255 [Rheinheimera sp. SA_1]